MSILIVDDSFFNRKLVETLLKKAGYTDIIHAESANEAYSKLEEQKQNLSINIILLDIMMPEIDGIKACAHIKQIPSYKDIPIIMVTAKDDSQSLQSAFDAGAIDYITKPVNPTILKARVRSALTLKKEMDRRKAREQDLIDIGAKIQTTLLLGELPKTFPGLEISAFTQASQKIDGDFYDYFCQKDQHLDIFIGDVMGKGVPAALVGAATKATFYRIITQLLSENHTHSLPKIEKIIQQVHNIMSNELIELETFVTLCYIRYHSKTKSVDLVDCGHTQTIHFHSATKECTFIKGDNTPLGFIQNEVYLQQSFFLKPGDILFLYSDGFTEACDPDGDFFGEKKLIECIKEHCKESPSNLIKIIHNRITKFTNTNQLGDDLTCVVLKRIDEATKQNVLKIKSALTELQKVRQFVGFYCQSIKTGPQPKKFLWQLETAIVELISNIIKYAYLGEEQHEIVINASSESNCVIFTFFHWGNPFPHPPTSPKPPEEEYPEGGYGLFIIDNYIDECEYSFDKDGCNSIVLIKNCFNS